MTRTFTACCVAAAFGMAASVGAQSTATSTTSSTDRSSAYSEHNRNGEVTVTGCLMRGANGNYILTNARLGSETGSTGGASGAYHGDTSTTAGTTGTTSGTTAGATAGTTTGTSNRGSSMESARTFELTGGKDLDRHVGHMITVTGREEGTSRQNEYGANTGTTGTTAGAMAGSTAGTTGSTAGTTTGTTAQTGSTEHQGMRGNESTIQRLDVKSVKMVSTSCS